jgi:hypothetical protein
MPELNEARQISEALAAAKQQDLNRTLRNALRLLSKELYGRDVHFVMELVQNAEDNDYPEQVTDRFIEFIVKPDAIEVRNNEVGFTRPNVESLCDVGESTKRERTLGYIGEKGIGFKSVFKISDRPRIFSSGFCFELDDHDYIVPHWCDPPSHVDPQRATTIILPLRHDYREGGERPIGAQVADLDPRTLLFLRKLSRIVVVDETAGTNVSFQRSPLATAS